MFSVVYCCDIWTMEQIEEDRILRLIESIEKEEQREEERHVNPRAVRRLLFRDESAIECIDDIASNDEKDDNFEVQELNTDSEQSAEEEDVQEAIRQTPTGEEVQDEANVTVPQYIGKDKETTWDIHCPPRNRRTSAQNIVRHLPRAKVHIPINNTMCFSK